MSAAERRLSEAGWLTLGLVLRVAFILRLGDRFYQIDEASYVDSARQWAATGVIGGAGHAAVLPPLPAVFFGVFFRLGSLLRWPRLGQALLGTACAWLIGRMTRVLTGSERAGRAALIIACVYPFFIYYGGMLMSESLYTTAVVCGLFALCASLADNGRNLLLAAAAGFGFGLSALARPEGAPIAAAIWAAALAAVLAGRWSRRAWLVAVLAWALPVFSWCARNQAVTGRFSLDNHGGLAMLHGTMLLDLNEQDTGVAMEAFHHTELYQNSLALDDAARDRAYFRAGLRWMAEHPGETARQWGRKLVNFWRFYPRPDKRYSESAGSQPAAGFARWALVAVSLIFEPALILGGLWGLWGLRERWANLFPLTFFLLGTMAVHVVSVSQMRYRLPVMPILILGAASAWECFRSRRPSST